MSSTLAQEHARASAQRGLLDAVYKELSDEMSASMQRLFPVWVLLGPGLADPAHIELRSRTTYLDSDELLGSRTEIMAGSLQPRRIQVTFGAAIHETLHAVETKLWVAEHNATLAASNDPDEQQLAVDRILLEEPRMEATGLRRFQPGGARDTFARKALAVCVTDVILSRFRDQVMAAALTGAPVTRDMCGRAMTYLQARTHYGVVDPATLAGLHGIWTQVLGPSDVQALDDLYRRLIFVPSGDNDALSAVAIEYRDIIGPPDTGDGDGDGDGEGTESADRPTSTGAGADDSDGDGGQGGASADPDGPDRPAPSARSLSEALEDAQQQQNDDQLRQLDEDVSLREVLDRSAGQGPPASQGGVGARGTGAPTGRMPKRGVDRPPMGDEIAQARRYSDRIRRAVTAATKRVDKRTPGGRFNARAYVRSQYERSHGRPVTSQPWSIQRDVHRPVQEPHVLLVIDTSGSMGAYEYALGPIAWILTEGLRVVDGRLAITLFGNGMELLTDGTKRMPLVPGIRVGGGTAFAGDAIVEGCSHLEMTNQRRPRMVYILSDGGWYDTEAGVRQIHWLREQGVPTMHISIGALPPLSVDADRITVIEDPADALDIVARDTVDALEKAARRPARR